MHVVLSLIYIMNVFSLYCYYLLMLHHACLKDWFDFDFNQSPGLIIGLEICFLLNKIVYVILNNFSRFLPM